MYEWCSAHPWMTFIILVMIFSGPVITIRCRNEK